MDAYKTIIVQDMMDGVRVIFNRVLKRNSISDELLFELNELMNKLEKNDACKSIVLEGQEGFFCTGMDFEEAVKNSHELKTADEKQKASSLYMDTLKRFSLCEKVIISKVDGQVMAGGIGVVAASDLVIATPRSTFTLSEALWGLLPACVTPFLIRRVGFQHAYRMTLTTMSVAAQEAFRFGLVDEITENPDDSLRKMSLRLKRVKPATIGKMKRYFRDMWILHENMENRAVSELSGLLGDAAVQANLNRFVSSGRFPWEE
jgi:polyketide biosynthesis enoyl-CoA hydratase PksH